jgi:hypothetical protein
VPDLRWPSGAFSHITGLSVTNFEIVQTTGATEGPRSPGAPVVNAGPDRVVQRGVPVSLTGTVQSSGTAPLTVQWKVYSGPGAATFGNAGQTNTTATFQAPGQYVLMLSADNNIHTPGFDAAVFTVQDAIQLSLERSGTNITVRWTGGNPPYEVQSSTSIPPVQWTSRGTYSTNFATFPMTSGAMFFRVRGQ